jgi:hypothetical protein
MGGKGRVTGAPRGSVGGGSAAIGPAAGRAGAGRFGQLSSLSYRSRRKAEIGQGRSAGLAIWMTASSPLRSFEGLAWISDRGLDFSLDRTRPS